MGIFVGNNKQRRAYTYKEIMLALVIIGILVAALLPLTLNKIKKRVLVVKLQKAYMVLNQAYFMSHNANDGEPSADYIIDNAREYANDYWLRFLGGAKECDNHNNCGYLDNTHFKYTKGGNATHSDAFKNNTRFIFQTPDNITFIVFVGTLNKDEKKSSKIVLVDLNSGAAPNKFGEDVFFFVRTDTGFVRPYGFEKSYDKIQSNCSETGKGTYCAEKISRDGWVISPDYPIKM